MSRPVEDRSRGVSSISAMMGRVEECGVGVPVLKTVYGFEDYGFGPRRRPEENQIDRWGVAVLHVFVPKR